MDNIYEIILKNEKTVFPIQTLKMISGSRGTKLSKSLNYYVNCKKIGNPRRGIYTKKDYSKEEMACSIFSFSYLSLEYVLQRSGIVFQYDEAITCISYLNRSISIDGHSYSYRRINPEIYINREGIIKKGSIYMATPERAFLDMMYLSYGQCYFDNLRPLNLEFVDKLLPNYRSDRLTRQVKALF